MGSQVRFLSRPPNLKQTPGPIYGGGDRNRTRKTNDFCPKSPPNLKQTPGPIYGGGDRNRTRKTDDFCPKSPPNLKQTPGPIYGGGDRNRTRKTDDFCPKSPPNLKQTPGPIYGGGDRNRTRKTNDFCPKSPPNLKQTPGPIYGGPLLKLNEPLCVSISLIVNLGRSETVNQELLTQLYVNKGLTITEIAKRTGHTRTTLRAHSKKLGLKKKKTCYQKQVLEFLFSALAGNV